MIETPHHTVLFNNCAVSIKIMAFIDGHADFRINRIMSMIQSQYNLQVPRVVVYLRGEKNTCESCGNVFYGSVARRFCGRRCGGRERNTSKIKLQRKPPPVYTSPVNATGWGW